MSFIFFVHDLKTIDISPNSDKFVLLVLIVENVRKENISSMDDNHGDSYVPINPFGLIEINKKCLLYE